MSDGEYLYPDFLVDSEQYEASKELWISGLMRVTPPNLWRGYRPYVAETFANGSPQMDGNPMISALNWRRARAVRVVQLDPLEFRLHYGTSLERKELRRSSRYPAGSVDELLILLTLTSENYERALRDIGDWLYGDLMPGTPVPSERVRGQ